MAEPINKEDLKEALKDLASKADVKAIGGDIKGIHEDLIKHDERAEKMMEMLEELSRIDRIERRLTKVEEKVGL